MFTESLLFFLRSKSFPSVSHTRCLCLPIPPKRRRELYSSNGHLPYPSTFGFGKRGGTVLLSKCPVEPLFFYEEVVGRLEFRDSFISSVSPISKGRKTSFLPRPFEDDSLRRDRGLFFNSVHFFPYFDSGVPAALPPHPFLRP